MNTQILELLRKYTYGTCNQPELEQVYSILKQGKHLNEWKYIIDEEAAAGMDADIDIQMISAADAEKLNTRILQTLAHQPEVKVNSRIRLWPHITIAASLLIILGVGISFFLQTQHPSGFVLAPEKDISPANGGTTLTLSNGNKISLKEALAGNIAEEAGVKIFKKADGTIIYKVIHQKPNQSGTNTLSTGRGEQTQVQLPDGSLVYLNAESSITYPASFSAQPKRKVSLMGEAYFEVAKDQQHPFIVSSGQQQLEVLGTHFNINSYSNEPVVKTTLVEGSVHIFSGQADEILTPEHQATVANGRIRISAVDTDLALAWKNNNFVFDVLSIQEIMRMLERWYNIETVYVGPPPSGALWGSVSRFDHISKVLISLEATGKVHFEIKGRKIFVSQ